MNFNFVSRKIKVTKRALERKGLVPVVPEQFWTLPSGGDDCSRSVYVDGEEQ